MTLRAAHAPVQQFQQLTSDMIDPNAEPIAYRNPYPRIDGLRRRKATISDAEVMAGEIPDEQYYQYDWNHRHWVLKGGGHD